MFVHAISSSTETAPNSSHSDARLRPTTLSFSGSTRIGEPTIRVGICFRELRLHDRQIGGRLLHCHAAAELADDGVPRQRSWLRPRRIGDRSPHVHVALGELEQRRHHADGRDRRIADVDRAADGGQDRRLLHANSDQ